MKSQDYFAEKMEIWGNRNFSVFSVKARKWAGDHLFRQVIPVLDPLTRKRKKVFFFSQSFTLYDHPNG
jgi:hypothetical protein